MQTLFLDISNITNMNMTPKSADGSVFLQSKQGDVGRQFKAVIMDGEQAFPIPPGAQFSVWYSGPSGEGNYSSVGDRSAFYVEGNTVTVEMIAQMLKKPGSGTMCLVLNTAQGKQLGLWNVIYAVEHVAGMDSEPAEDYYTALSELARQAISAAATFETDASLTVAGKAADAAAVGAGLAGKAPAGFGLGEADGKYLTDCNAATVPGFYSLAGDGCANYPTAYSALCSGTLLVERRQKQINQTVTCNNIKAMRYSADSGSTWSEWEYINPPMALGVEYRTTERWDGKVVYTKAVDLGALPASGEKSVNYTSKAATNVVSLEAHAVSASGTVNGFPFYTSTSELRGKVSASGFNIYIDAFSDMSGHTGYAIIKYTKD